MTIILLTYLVDEPREVTHKILGVQKNIKPTYMVGTQKLKGNRCSKEREIKERSMFRKQIAGIRDMP